MGFFALNKVKKREQVGLKMKIKGHNLIKKKAKKKGVFGPKTPSYWQKNVVAGETPLPFMEKSELFFQISQPIPYVISCEG